MLGFVWWIIVGCIAGFLARLLVPGSQPMGWVYTIVLGLIGSIVGGFLSSITFGTDPQNRDFQASGLIMSTVGAVIALSLYLAYDLRDKSECVWEDVALELLQL